LRGRKPSVRHASKPMGSHWSPERSMCAGHRNAGISMIELTPFLLAILTSTEAQGQACRYPNDLLEPLLLSACWFTSVGVIDIEEHGEGGTAQAIIEDVFGVPVPAPLVLGPREAPLEGRVPPPGRYLSFVKGRTGDALLNAWGRYVTPGVPFPDWCLYWSYD